MDGKSAKHGNTPATDAEPQAKRRKKVVEESIVLTGGEPTGGGIISQWRDQKLCDVQVVAGGVTNGAHRVVLAGGSAYMAARFGIGMSDSSEAIELSDIDADTFKQVIEWLYTGMCKISEERLLDLLAAAMRFQVEALQAACVKAVVARVTVDNCIGALTLADQCGIPELEAVAMKLATCNFDAVTQLSDFASLPARCLEALLALDRLAVSHEDVACSAVLAWLRMQAVPPPPEARFRLLRRLRLVWASFEALAALRSDKLIASRPREMELVFQGYEAKAGKHFRGSFQSSETKLTGPEEQECVKGSVLPRAGYDPKDVLRNDPRRIRSNAFSLCCRADSWGDASDQSVHEALEKKRAWPQDLFPHPNLNAKMRTILIDWLFDVADMYSIMIDTVHVAVDLCDRYVAANRDLTRKNFQAMGIASLVVAIRCEESSVLALSQAAHVCDSSYTTDEIGKWVARISKLVGHSPAVTTSRAALACLHQYSRRVGGVNVLAETCALYICDTALLSVDVLAYTTTVVAASAIDLARHAVGADPIDWDSMPLASPTVACMEALVAAFACPTFSKEEGVHAYYQQATWFGVSKLKISMPPSRLTEHGFAGGERVRVPRRSEWVRPKVELDWGVEAETGAA